MIANFATDLLSEYRIFYLHINQLNFIFHAEI